MKVIDNISARLKSRSDQINKNLETANMLERDFHMDFNSKSKTDELSNKLENVIMDNQSIGNSIRKVTEDMSVIADFDEFTKHLENIDSSVE